MHVHVVDQHLRDAGKEGGHIELIVVGRLEAGVEGRAQTLGLAAVHQAGDLHVSLVHDSGAVGAADARDVGGQLLVDGCEWLGDYVILTRLLWTNAAVYITK